MIIKCIIIEDEPLAQQKLASYLQSVSELELVASFENSLDALVYIKTNEVDLVFLDIQVAGLHGIQLLESVNLNTEVIITTAHHEFALKGYELNVADYLLKPFSKERLQQAAQKAIHRIEVKRTTSKANESFFIKSGHKLERIEYNELLFIEGVRDYRKLHLANRQVMTLETFREFETALNPEIMIRIHKSYMVNLHKISSVERNELTVSETVLPISESYRDTFHATFNRFFRTNNG